MCHGAGGLASQYAFGARSNVSMLFLGSLKIIIALLFGNSCLELLQRGIFPASVLGVLLAYSGLNLAAVALDTNIHNKNEVIILLMTAGFSLAKNTGIGFIAGIVTAIVLHLSPYSSTMQPNSARMQH